MNLFKKIKAKSIKLKELSQKRNQATYQLARGLYNGTLSWDEACEQAKDLQLSENQLQHATESLKALLVGFGFKGGISSQILSDFLNKIHQNDGDISLARAISTIEAFLQELVVNDPSSPQIQSLRKTIQSYRTQTHCPVPTLTHFVPHNSLESLQLKTTVNKIELDPNIREDCIDIYGPCCYVCDIDLADKYGDIGIDMLEIHHIPYNLDVDEKHEPEVGKDLVPLCPNCHAAIHRKKVPDHPDVLKQYLKNLELSEDDDYVV